MEKKVLVGSILIAGILALAWCLMRYTTEPQDFAAVSGRDADVKQPLVGAGADGIPSAPTATHADDTAGPDDEEDEPVSDPAAEISSTEEAEFSERQGTCLLLDELTRLAMSHSPEDLVRMILEHPRKRLHTENEISWKAAWALALLADRKPREICELLYHTLERMDTASTTTERLLAILGYCQREEAQEVLIRLLRSGWAADREHLLMALAQAGGKSFGTIEEQIRDIGTCSPDDRGFHVLWMGGMAYSRYLFPVATANALLDVYERDAKDWKWADRSWLISALRVVLSNWKYATQRMQRHGMELPPSDHIYRISARLKRDLAVAEDAKERWQLLRALCEAPDDDVSFILCRYMEHDPSERVRLNCTVQTASFKHLPHVQETLLRVARNDPSASVRLCALRALPATGEFTAWKIKLAMEEYHAANCGTWAGYAIRRKAVEALHSAGLAGLPHLRSIAESDPHTLLQEDARRFINFLERRAQQEEVDRQKK